MPNASSTGVRPWQDVAVVVGSFLFSAIAMFYVGRLGFQFEDLSIPFDGGYRILSGQQPFVDFMAPTGPVLFLQQAAFFAVLGVNLNAYLWHAVVLNGIAGCLVWSLLRRRHAPLAAVASLATVCWFFLPPGAPYIDSNAFFWSLVCLWAIAYGRGLMGPPEAPRPPTKPWRQGVLLFVAGFAACLAFLSKQNIGGLAFGGLTLLLVFDLHRFPSSGQQQAKGTVLPSLCFFVGLAVPWMSLLSEVTWNGGFFEFERYFWQIPAESGRLKMLIPWSLRMMIKVFRPDAVGSSFAYMLGPALRELAVYGLSTVLAWRWWGLRKALDETAKSQRFWLAATVFLLLQQQWSYNTSNNNASLYWPYFGLLWALVALHFLGRQVGGRLTGRRGAVAMVVGLLIAAAGFGVSAQRWVHDINPSALGPPLDVARLEGLRLYPQEGEDFTALVTFIEANVPSDESFFVLGDPSVLYGVTGRPSPPGLLWYRNGVSYLAADNGPADDRITRTLGDGPIHWVIVDGVGHDELLEDFPGVRRYLEERFRQVEEIGPYRVYGR